MPLRKGKQLKELLHESLVLAITLYSQPGPHPPCVPSSSSPAECQDQSKLCIALSLEMKKYCKLKYSRCDLHDSSQTLNTRDQCGIYNLPVFPRFVRKASSLFASLPLCPSPCTDLSWGDPRAVTIWSARSRMILRDSRLCPRTLLGLSVDIPSNGCRIDAPPTFFGARRRRCAEMAIFCFRTLPDLVRALVQCMGRIICWSISRLSQLAVISTSTFNLHCVSKK